MQNRLKKKQMVEGDKHYISPVKRNMAGMRRGAKKVERYTHTRVKA